MIYMKVLMPIVALSWNKKEYELLHRYQEFYGSKKGICQKKPKYNNYYIFGEEQH